MRHAVVVALVASGLLLAAGADPAALPLSKNIISFATADDTLYDFVTTSASLGGTTPSVPEGSSAALAATALLALWASRRPRLR